MKSKQEILLELANAIAEAKEASYGKSLDDLCLFSVAVRADDTIVCMSKNRAVTSDVIVYTAAIGEYRKDFTSARWEKVIRKALREMSKRGLYVSQGKAISTRKQTELKFEGSV